MGEGSGRSTLGTVAMTEESVTPTLAIDEAWQ